MAAMLHFQRSHQSTCSQTFPQYYPSSFPFPNLQYCSHRHVVWTYSLELSVFRARSACPIFSATLNLQLLLWRRLGARKYVDNPATRLGKSKIRKGSRELACSLCLLRSDPWSLPIQRWEFIKENKKVRKHAFDQESDQEKKKKGKKTRSRPRK